MAKLQLIGCRHCHSDFVQKHMLVRLMKIDGYMPLFISGLGQCGTWRIKYLFERTLGEGRASGGAFW